MPFASPFPAVAPFSPRERPLDPAGFGDPQQFNLENDFTGGRGGSLLDNLESLPTVPEEEAMPLGLEPYIPPKNHAIGEGLMSDAEFEALLNQSTAKQYPYLKPEQITGGDNAMLGLQNLWAEQRQGLPHLSQPVSKMVPDGGGLNFSLPGGIAQNSSNAKTGRAGESAIVSEMDALRDEIKGRMERGGTLLDAKMAPKFARLEQLKSLFKAQKPSIAGTKAFKAFDAETRKWHEKVQKGVAAAHRNDIQRLRDENPNLLAGNELAGAAQGVLTGGVQLASPLMRAMGQGDEADRILNEAKALGEAQQANVKAAKMGWLRGGLNEALPGVTASLTQAAALGPIGRIAKTMKAASMLSTAAMATGFGATTANDAYSEAKKAGLPTSEAVKYAAIQGGLEAGIMLIFLGLASKIPGIGGMEEYFTRGGKQLGKETGRQWLWRMSKGLMGENIEENTTTILQQINSAMSLPGAEDQANWFDPKKTGFASFWDSPMMQAVRQTTSQTMWMMGLAETGSQAGRLLQRRLDRFIENPSEVNYRSAVDAGLPPIENPNRANRAEIADSLPVIREAISKPENDAGAQQPASPEIVPSNVSEPQKGGDSNVLQEEGQRGEGRQGLLNPPSPPQSAAGAGVGSAPVDSNISDTEAEIERYLREQADEGLPGVPAPSAAPLGASSDQGDADAIDLNSLRTGAGAAIDTAPAISPNNKTVDRKLKDGLLSSDGSRASIDEAFADAGYVNVDGFWVHPSVDPAWVSGLKPETKERLKAGGIVYFKAEPTYAASTASIQAGDTTLRGIHARTDRSVGAELFDKKDEHALHELGHHIWQEELTDEQRTAFAEGGLRTQHGREVAGGKDGYRTNAGIYQHGQAAEEDFAQHFAENNGDLTRTLTQPAPVATGGTVADGGGDSAPVGSSDKPRTNLGQTLDKPVASESDIEAMLRELEAENQPAAAETVAEPPVASPEVAAAPAEPAAPPEPKKKPLNMAGKTRESKTATATPEFSSVHPKAQEKFNAAWDAKDAAAMTDLLDKMNKGLRAEFERRSGKKLPKTAKGTAEIVANYFASPPAPASSSPTATAPHGDERGAGGAPQSPASPAAWQLSPKQYARSQVGKKVERTNGMGRADTVTANHRAEVRKAFADGQDVPWAALEPYLDDFKREGMGDKLAARVQADVAAGRDVPDAARRRYPPEQKKEALAASKPEITQSPKTTKLQPDNPTIPKYERTGPASDSAEIEAAKAKREEYRKEETDAYEWVKKLSKERDGLKRNATKKRRELDDAIRHHGERQRKAQIAGTAQQRIIDKAKIEDILEKPRSYDHFLKAMSELHDLDVYSALDEKNEAQTRRDQRRGERDDVVAFYQDRQNKAQHESDRYALELIDRAKSLAANDGTLNKDETQSVAEEAYRAFSYLTPSLQEAVDRATKRVKEARKGGRDGAIDRLYNLGKERQNAYKAELAAAEQGGSDWWDKSEAILERAKKEASAKDEERKAEAERVLAETRAAAEKQKAENEAAARARAKEFAAEKRAWKRLDERTKATKWAKETYTVKEGPNNENVSQVQGEVVGPFGVREDVSRDEGGVATGKEFTVTHIPTGMPVSTYTTKANARLLAVWLTESGVNWESPAVAETGKMTGDDAKIAKRWIKAFDDNDLDVLNPDEKASLLAAAGPKESGVVADLVLDAVDFGIGSKNEIPFAKKIKEMAAAVPEFAYNPVFTVQGRESIKEMGKDKWGRKVEIVRNQGSLKLVFKDGIEFAFNPEVFGLDPADLTPGQTIGINLEDLGIKKLDATGMVAAVFKEKGFQVTVGKSNDSILARWKPTPYTGRMMSVSLLPGEDGKWHISKAEGLDSSKKSVPQSVQIARQVLDGIRWVQPGQAADGVKPSDVSQSEAASPQSTLSDKAAAATQQMKDDAAAFIKTMRGKATSLGSFSQESLKAFTKLTVSAINAGALNFADYVSKMSAALGDMADELRPLMKQVWPKLAAKYGLDPSTEIAEKAEQPEAPEQSEKPAKAEPSGPTLFEGNKTEASGDDTYSIKRRKVDEFHEKYGWAEVEKPTTPTMEAGQIQMDELAKQQIANEPSYGELLMDRMLSDPDNASVSRLDVAVMQRLAAESQVEWEKAVERLREVQSSNADPKRIADLNREAELLEDKARRVHQVGAIVSRTWHGIGFQLQAEFDREFNRLDMELVWSLADEGRPVDAEGKKQLERISNEAKKLKEEKARLEKALEEANLEAAAQKAHAAAVQDVLKSEQERRKAAEDALARAKTQPAAGHTTGKASPRPRKEAAHKDTLAALDRLRKAIVQIGTNRPHALGIAEVGLEMANVARAYIVEQVASFQDFIDRLRADAKDLADQFPESEWRQTWATESQKDITDKIADEYDPDNAASLTPIARELHRMVIERDGLGMSDRKKATHAVQEILKEFIPDITITDTAKAMTGYDIYHPLNNNRIDVIRREQNAQLGTLLNIGEIWRTGQAKARGQERTPSSDEQRALAKIRNQVKKRHGKPTEAERAGQLKSTLASMKTSLRNRIKDLQKEIDTKKRKVKTPAPSPTDAELESLRADLEHVRTLHEEVFGKRQLTDAQRQSMLEKGLDRRYAELLKMKESGKLLPDEKRVTPTTPGIEAKRARNAAELAAIEELRLQSPEYAAEFDRREEAKYVRQQLKRIAAWKERIANEDFGPRPLKPERRRTPEMEKNDIALEKLREEFAKGKRERWLKNRHPMKKLLDWTVLHPANILRKFLTSFDASLIGRQGWLSWVSHPILTAKATRQGFAQNPVHARSIFPSVDDYHRAITAIKNNPEMMDLVERSKVNLTEISGHLNREEGFQEVPDWVNKIPGLGGSERSASAFMDTLRTALVYQMTTNLAQRRAANGEPALTNAELRVIGHNVNAMTGRQSLSQKADSSKWLARIFFSARWKASRMLWPVAGNVWLWENKWLGTGEGIGWDVRRAMLGEWAKQVAGVSAVIGSTVGLLALAYGAGGPDKEWEIVTDKKDPKYLQIRIGDRWIDFTTGIGSLLSFPVRLWSGEKKSGQRTKKIDRYHEAGRFVHGNLAPVPGFVADNVFGSIDGTEVGSKAWYAGRLTPLIAQDIEKLSDKNHLAESSIWDTLAFFGAGVKADRADVRDRRDAAGEIQALRNRAKQSPSMQPELNSRIQSLIHDHLKSAVTQELKRDIAKEKDASKRESLSARLAEAKDSSAEKPLSRELAADFQKEKQDLTNLASQRLSTEFGKTPKGKPPKSSDDDESIQASRALMREVAPKLEDAARLLSESIIAKGGKPRNEGYRDNFARLRSIYDAAAPRK